MEITDHKLDGSKGESPRLVGQLISCAVWLESFGFGSAERAIFKAASKFCTHSVALALTAVAA